MMCRHLTAMLIALLLCCVANADEPKTFFHYMPPEGGSFANLDVTQSLLREVDVHRWARFLHASDAQRTFIVALYTRFLDHHNDVMDRLAPDFLAQAAALVELGRRAGTESREYVDATADLDQFGRRLRQQLLEVELDFINSFEHILTEEQSGRLEVLRYEARRRHCRIFRSLMRWSDIELRQIWAASAQPQASPEEANLVDAMLVDYERRLTSLVCRCADEMYVRRLALLENRLAQDQGVVTLDESRARYRQIINRKLAVARPIGLLNAQTARLIAAAVSEEVAVEFVAAAKRAVFPEIYPDRSALHQVFHDVANHSDLSRDQQDAVAALFDAYQNEHTRINDRLEELCAEWGEKGDEGVMGYQPQFLSRALRPILDERTELSSIYQQRLEEIVGSDWLTRYRQGLSIAYP
ncbi:MAG TPA: hypothetical protein PK098_10930 [Phycisphaerales bacterium]|nr:hypothetical protein [Phycisphaerales bacterium]